MSKLKNLLFKYEPNNLRLFALTYLTISIIVSSVLLFSNAWSRYKNKKELKKILTPVQYHVTQEGGTEVAYDNAYWDNTERGIYVDIVSGEPLFSSRDQYNAKTGWPSFTIPLESKNVVIKRESIFSKRMVVRSKLADSHLGFLYYDGPEPTGLRYSINSAALRFIPIEDLIKEGYIKYLDLFLNKEKIELATFGGGCFWCMEQPFDELDGVLKTTSGYMGGRIADPTHEQVGTGLTGHIEVNQIMFDSFIISYEKLLRIYWRNIDPTDAEGQFTDRGNQYRPVIFYHSPEQEKLARESKTEMYQSGIFDGPIVVEILPASEFYKAKEKHQDYYQKKPVRYKFYRLNTGRDEFLEEIWGY